MSAKINDRISTAEIIEYFWNKNDALNGENKFQKSEIKRLQKENSYLQSNLQSIIDSKGWQFLEKVRKITHVKNTKT